jgi:hypothetical protein
MTNFDTVVYIRKGNCFNAMPMNEVACNDDNAAAMPPAGVCAGSNDGLHSYARTGPLTPGIYFIFVDGYVSTSEGMFQLTVTTTP